MFRLLTFIIFIFSFVPAIIGDEGEAEVRLLNIGDSIELESKDNGAQFEFYEVQLKFETIKAKGEEYIEEVVLTIKREDEEPLRVTSLASAPGFANIGLYIFEPDGAPIIMFQSFSGGAHCCAVVNLINLGAEELKNVELGVFDGDFLYPEDVDNDGVLEIKTYDNRFLYAFDSYVDSFPPSQIYAFKNGEIYDASFEARFDKIFEENYQNMYPECLIGEDGLHAGACAGLLAVSARLDKYRQVKKLVAKAIKQQGGVNSIFDDYIFCKGDECKENIQFKRFLPAVEFALKRWGYLSKQDNVGKNKKNKKKK